MAILLVLGRHMEPVQADGGFLQNALAAFTNLWMKGGWTGVDLFFVLSGFLVSGLLFKEYIKHGRISGIRFLIRRGLKIYPAYYVFIALLCVERLIHHHFSPRELVYQLLFIQNYTIAWMPHTWSLAVEEHFYILLLVFLLIVVKFRTANPFRAVPVAFVVLGLGCLAMRIAVVLVPFKFSFFPTHLRIDSLFAGVLLSYFFHFHHGQFRAVVARWKLLLVAAGCFLYVPAFVLTIENSPFLFTFGLSLLYIASALILSVAVVLPEPLGKGFSALAYIGSHSYSIYLWHWPVKEWLVPLCKAALPDWWSWPVYFGLYFFGSLLVGIAMSLLVEFPVLKLRDRLFPSRVSVVSHPD